MSFNNDPDWFNATSLMLKWWEKPRWWFKPRLVSERDGVRIKMRFDDKRRKTLITKIILLDKEK